MDKPLRGEGRSALGRGGVGGGGLGMIGAGGVPPRREVFWMRTGILEMNLSGVRGECSEGVWRELGGRSRFASTSWRLK